MKARILKLVNYVALAALAFGLSTARGTAQEVYRGEFSLPFEARWGGVTLPAGDYTIDLRSADQFLVVRSGAKSALILKGAPDTKPVSDHSQLTVVDVDGHKVIKSLEAGQIGLAFDYHVPKAKMQSMQGTLIPVLKVNDSTAGS
ncbi:MAG TPA: hypothetical protein VG204_21760 [Terriglobia bacterium]|nr:hypothetical protein [Terriglobia bacterium]